MNRNYQTDKNNRIILTTEFPYDNTGPTLCFTDDFDFEKQNDYKIINGELVYDPVIIRNSEIGE